MPQFLTFNFISHFPVTQTNSSILLIEEHRPDIVGQLSALSDGGAVLCSESDVGRVIAPFMRTFTAVIQNAQYMVNY